jgi:hypothetical protein
LATTDDGSCGTVELYLEINPDPWPEEIGWSLTADDTDIIIAGAYPLQNVNSQTYALL